MEIACECDIGLFLNMSGLEHVYAHVETYKASGQSICVEI